MKRDKKDKTITMVARSLLLKERAVADAYSELHTLEIDLGNRFSAEVFDDVLDLLGLPRDPPYDREWLTVAWWDAEMDVDQFIRKVQREVKRLQKECV